MNMTPIIDTFSMEFKKSMNETCDFSGEQDLTPDIASRFFAGLSASISRAACAGIVHFLKAHDIDEPSVMKDGVKLNAAGVSTKEYLTPFGMISLDRNNYQAYWGGETYQPLDEKWGMKGEFATEPVRECATFHAAFMSPTEIVACLSKSSLFQISKTGIDNILAEMGERTTGSFDELHEVMLESRNVPENVDALVCSMDGANILTREPGKKKGRPTERPRNEDGKTEPQSSYRNAMVGSFSLYKTGDEEKDATRVGASYVARSPEPNFSTFKEDFEREFKWWNEKLNPAVNRVLLHDGGRNIWNYCDNNPLFDDFLKLLDFYHATEHLSLASEAIFGKQSDKGKTWYAKWCRKLKSDNDGVQGLIRSLNYYELSIRGKNRMDALARELTFFTRNADRMNYRSFLDMGLPIGSGPVEAACKSIVKQRMCKSGQRWSLNGAQHILHIRAVVKSGYWDAYWNHLEQTRLKEVA